MKKNAILICLLIAYCLLLVKVMIFKDIPSFRVGSLLLNYGGTNGRYPANFVPFKTIASYLSGNRGLLNAYVNLLGNIVLLVPVGFLISRIWPVSSLKMFVIGVASGLAIEVTQLKLQVGIFDIDDVLLNCVGVMIGYWINLGFMRWMHAGHNRKIAWAAGICVGVAVVSLYALFTGRLAGLRADVWSKDIAAAKVINKKSSGGNVNDLCNGTGGTGEIIAIQNRQIRIRLNNGRSQVVKLSGRTTIMNFRGLATIADLKKGDRVTVVIDRSEVATAVLVCNEISRSFE